VVVKSPPDGHVLLVGSHGISYQSSFFKDTPYDWQKDIAPVAKIAGSGYAMMVHSSVPAKTLADFVAWVKANPGKLNHGLAGSYTPEMEDMKSKMGVTGLIVHVMYKGGAPLTQAITVGEVHLMFGGVFQAVPLAQSGKIRILAYTGHARHAAMPDVPTSAEAGFPGAEGGFWLGMYAPAATPVPVIARLNAEINAMNRDPATLEIYRKQGYETWTVTPAQMRAEMLDLQKNAASVVKLLGIKPE
jgi:tripartite-type tricarboxylate transporter receptor subunit TctC